MATNGRALLRATARASWSAGTTWGSAACSTGSNTAPRNPSTAATTSTSANPAVPVSTANARPVITAARSPMHTSMIRLRFHRSAITPAGTIATMFAAINTDEAMPMLSGEPASARISRGKAIWVISAASSEKSWLLHRMW